MRNAPSALVLLAVAFLGGCASKANVAAKAPTPHISVSMDEETQRALLGLTDDEPLSDSGPVGTTTLTSADLYVAPATPAAPAAALPEERGSLSMLRTWGVAPVSDVDGIPIARE